MYSGHSIRFEHVLVASAFVFVVGVLSGAYRTPPVQAECALDDCAFTFTCNIAMDSWTPGEGVWQKIHVKPVSNTGRSELRWKPTTNEFPPLRYTACWGTGAPQSCEYVDIDGTGTDVSTQPHPNIRFHRGTIQLCDGFAPVAPFQVSSGNGCITHIEYNFDVRKEVLGQCFNGSRGQQLQQNGNLVAAPLVNNDCSGTAWTWVSPQKLQNFGVCHIASYLVRYTP